MDSPMESPSPDVAIGLAALCSILLLLCWVMVVARTVVRMRMKAFRADDWLMILGLILFTATCAFATVCAFRGLHAYDADMANPDYMSGGCIWFLLLQLFYTLSSATIKSSICAFLLRFTVIPSLKGQRYAIYAAITLSCITGLVSAIGVLTQAAPQPVSAIWETPHGEPLAPIMVRWFSFFTAVMSILLDGLIAFLPMIIIWDITLSFDVKLGLIAVLGLGSLSCVATVAGLGFMIVYRHDRGVSGKSVLGICMVLELGIGIIAGSAGVLKPMFKKSGKRDSRQQVEHPRKPLGTRSGQGVQRSDSVRLQLLRNA